MRRREKKRKKKRKKRRRRRRLQHLSFFFSSRRNESPHIPPFPLFSFFFSEAIITLSSLFSFSLSRYPHSKERFWWPLSLSLSLPPLSSFVRQKREKACGEKEKERRDAAFNHGTEQSSKFVNMRSFFQTPLSVLDDFVNENSWRAKTLGKPTPTYNGFFCFWWMMGGKTRAVKILDLCRLQTPMFSLSFLPWTPIFG